MKTLSINKLHNEHTTWLNALAFYKDDLKVLEERITEVAKHNTDKEVLAYTDFYKNEIANRRKEAGTLSSEITQHEHLLSKKLSKNVTLENAVDHPLHRTQVKTFEEDVNKLRHELNAFASRWM